MEIARKLSGAILAVLVSVFLMINLHELGHTALSWLLGDNSAYYRLVEFGPHGFRCIGCNHYDALGLSYWSRVLVPLGGLLATQLVFWVSLYLIARHSRLRGAYAWVWLGVFLLDAAVQVVHALPVNITAIQAETGVDLADVGWLICSRFGVSATVFKLLLAIAGAGYLLLAARCSASVVRSGNNQAE